MSCGPAWRIGRCDVFRGAVVRSAIEAVSVGGPIARWAMFRRLGLRLPHPPAQEGENLWTSATRGAHSGGMDRGRVVSPLFVGRGSDLGRLGELLHEAARGEPAVVLVSGEAGVGKSRLVAELLTTRVPLDTRVLLGECNGFAPGSLPYGPIVGALRRLLHSSEAGADLLGDTGEALALLLPELKAAGGAIAAPLDQAQMFPLIETSLADAVCAVSLAPNERCS